MKNVESTVLGLGKELYICCKSNPMKSVKALSEQHYGTARLGFDGEIWLIG